MLLRVPWLHTTGDPSQNIEILVLSTHRGCAVHGTCMGDNMWMFTQVATVRMISGIRAPNAKANCTAGAMRLCQSCARCCSCIRHCLLHAGVRMYKSMHIAPEFWHALYMMEYTAKRPWELRRNTVAPCTPSVWALRERVHQNCARPVCPPSRQGAEHISLLDLHR